MVREEIKKKEKIRKKEKITKPKLCPRNTETNSDPVTTK